MSGIEMFVGRNDNDHHIMTVCLKLRTPFVNQINFIKKHGNINLSPNEENNILPVYIDNYSNQPSFPRNIYSRNKYYEFHQMNLSMKNKLVGSFSFNSILQAEIQESKLIFEDLKKTTIDTLHHMALENLQLIERLAYLQSKTKVS